MFLDRMLLSQKSEVNLALGAIVDLLGAYIVVTIFAIAVQAYVHPVAQTLLVLTIATPKYLWSVNLFQNHVPTYSKGAVTFLERIIPAGPMDQGLTPGYYWLPLGWPFYSLGIKESTKEFGIPFKQMQIWAKNTSGGGEGAIEGQVDGNVQFKVVDPAKFQAFTPDPKAALETLVLESARDICENLTIEGFIDERNDSLAGRILAKIQADALPGRAGVVAKSSNVSRTDNRDQTVKSSWAQVTAQRSINAARATDAQGRVQRIENYKTAGVDANRAAALDAVASDKAGATIGDQRFNLDVGESIKDIGNALINRIKR